MRSIYLGLVLTLASVGSSQALDLVHGTLDGLPLCSSNLDDVIDVLGRPTVVSGPPGLFTEIIGPTLHYHQLGFEFYFRPAPVAGQGRVARLGIYLSRTWHERSVEWYSPFSGTATPRIESSWRVSHTLAAFHGDEPRETTPDRAREQHDARMRETGMAPAPDARVFPHTVRVGLDEHSLLFNFEPVTRFLESATIICPPPK
jgi:hypothetical protein